MMPSVLQILAHVAACDVEEKLGLFLDGHVAELAAGMFQKNGAPDEAKIKKAADLFTMLGASRIRFAQMVLDDPGRAGLAFCIAVVTLSFRPEGIVVLGRHFRSDAAGVLTVGRPPPPPPPAEESTRTDSR